MQFNKYTHTHILDVRATELQQDLETNVELYIYENIHQVFRQICYFDERFQNYSKPLGTDID